MLYVLSTMACVIVVLMSSQKHALYYGWSAGTTMSPSYGFWATACRL